jgi:hypothetical protein
VSYAVLRPIGAAAALGATKSAAAANELDAAVTEAV